MSWTVSRKLKPGERTSVMSYDRVRKLACMFEEVQKKTFTKWVNVQLRDTGLAVEALEYDLRDGKVLLALLYTLARQTIPPTERGTMRIHRLANVGNALQFLERKLGGPLMNVGAEDIVDGNLKLTLGLVWVVILRFQIQRAAKAEAHSGNNNQSGGTSNSNSNNTQANNDAGALTAEPDSIANEDSSTTDDEKSKSEDHRRQSKAINQHDVRASLLGWVRNQTTNYVNAPEVTDFSRSWQSGCLFMILIHRYDPAILPNIDEILLKNGKEHWSDTLTEAFALAQTHLDITPLLEVEDIANMEVPDERSIMIYVSEFYVAMTARQNQDVLARCRAEEERRAEECRLAQADKCRTVEETRARRNSELANKEDKHESLQLKQGREQLSPVLLVPESPTDAFMEPAGNIEQQLRRMTLPKIPSHGGESSTSSALNSPTTAAAPTTIIATAIVSDPIEEISTNESYQHDSSIEEKKEEEEEEALPQSISEASIVADQVEDSDRESELAQDTPDPNYIEATSLYAEAETLYNQLMADCSRALEMMPEPRSMVTFATVADMKQFVERTTEISTCLRAIHEEDGLRTMREIREEITQLCPNSELIEDCDMLEESISALLTRLAEEEELCRLLSGEIVGLIRIAEAVQSIGESLEKSEADLDDMLGDGKSLNTTRIELIKIAVGDVIGMLQQKLPPSIPPAVANELHRSRELAERVTGRLDACDRYFLGDAQLNQMQSRIEAVKDNMTAISQFVPEALGAVIQEIENQLDTIDIDLKQMRFTTTDPDEDKELDDDFNEDISDMLNIRKFDLMEELLRTRSTFAQAKEDAYRMKRASFAIDECRRYIQDCLTIYREHTTEREKRLAQALVDNDTSSKDEAASIDKTAPKEQHINVIIQEIEVGFEKLQTMCSDGFEGHENIEKMLDEAERARDDVRSAIDLERNLDAMLTRYSDMVTFYAGVMQRIDKARSSLPTDSQYTKDKVKEPELMKIGSEIMRITADDCTALCDSIDEYSRSDFVLASELAGLDRFRMRVNMNYTQLMAAWNTLKAELESLRSDGNVNEQRLLYSRNISMVASRVNELHAAMLDATHDRQSALERLYELQSQVKELGEQLGRVIQDMENDDGTDSFQEVSHAVMEQLEQLEALTVSKIRDAELMEQFQDEMLDLDDDLNHLLNMVDESIVEAATVTNRDDIEMLIHRLSVCLTDAETEIPQRLADISSLAASINGRVASEEFSKFEKQWHETRSFAANELEALRKKRIHKPTVVLETIPDIAEDDSANEEEGTELPASASASATSSSAIEQRKHRRTNSNSTPSGHAHTSSTSSISHIPRRRSSSVSSVGEQPSASSSLASSASASTATPSLVSRPGFKWIRPMLVHPSPNRYVADTSDKLDVRVASIINECNMEIKIERTQPGRYIIGDVEPKAIFCRMLNDRMVMVRVGGGWVELSRYLSTHAALFHKLVPMDSNQQPTPLSPLYPIRLPARTLPTTPSSPGLTVTNTETNITTAPKSNRAHSSGSIPKSPRRSMRSPSLSPKLKARSISSPGVSPQPSPTMSRSSSASGKNKPTSRPLCRVTTDGSDVHIRMAIRMEQNYSRQ